MADSSQSGREKRLYERLGVIVPIEICVLSEPAGRVLAGPMHALVTDASVGGLRVELLGPAAALFFDGKLDSAHLAVTFLLSSLHDMGPLPCAIRWSKSLPDGYCLGLELTGQPIANRVLRVLASTSLPALARRAAVKAGLSAAAFLLIVGLGALTIDDQVVQKNLRVEVARLTEMAQSADDKARTLERDMRDAMDDVQRLEQKILACTAEQAGAHDDPEAPQNAAQADDGPVP